MITPQAIAGEIGKTWRALTKESSDSETTATEAVQSDFAAIMGEFLGADPASNVSEEDLFAAIIQERIKGLKGDEALAKFNEAFQAEKASRTRPDGFVPVEEAARAALGQLKQDGTLSAEEADKIHAEAFGAAQLDSDAEHLWDSRGGENDPTMAVQKMEAALLAAKAMLDKYTSGEAAAPDKPLEGVYDLAAHSGATVSGSGEGNPSDGAEGFLYKPVSDSSGNLVVLLPSSYTGNIAGVVLKDEAGAELGEGTYGGVGNGGREHFRFPQPGGEYPSNLTVEVRFKDGSIQTYLIADSSQRYD